MNQGAACDVFLSYNSKDRASVEVVAAELQKRGIAADLDTEVLLPGHLAIAGLENRLQSCRAVAVFLGPLVAWARISNGRNTTRWPGR
jgi:hypothetical protein